MYSRLQLGVSSPHIPGSSDVTNFTSLQAGGTEDQRAGAIIVAAGGSHRMQGVDKIFMPLLGVPLLSHTLAAFEAVPWIRSIVLVLNSTNLKQGMALVRKHGFGKVDEICQGGERRQDSVRQGLKHLGRQPWVIIHDGARPCVDRQLIELGLEEAVRCGSAVAAVPMKDTVKVVGAQGQVRETLDRQSLWTIQTPQVFSWEVLHQAYQQHDVTVTDDASLVERLGHRVHIYLGSYTNIKVTTREDGLVAETLLRYREGLAV